MLPGVEAVDRSQLGAVIRRARERQGLTQGQLGARLEANQSSVSTWEKGSVVPSVENLLKMADLLAVDVRAFFDAAISDHEAQR